MKAATGLPDIDAAKSHHFPSIRKNAALSGELNWNSSSPWALIDVCGELIGSAVKWVKSADFKTAIVSLKSRKGVTLKGVRMRISTIAHGASALGDGLAGVFSTTNVQDQLEMSIKPIVFSLAAILCHLNPINAKEAGDSLVKTLEVLSRHEKSTVDFGERGSLTLLPEYPKQNHLSPFRIDVGQQVRVLQGNAWNELADGEFDKVLGIYCMASRGVSPVPFIQVEIDADTDQKALVNLFERLLKLHVSAPQIEPIKSVFIAKRTAPKEAQKELKNR